MKGAAALLLGLAATACSHDFDSSYTTGEQQAIDNAQATLGFYIPADQDWKLTGEATANFIVPGESGQKYTVKIYSNNPFTEKVAYILDMKEVMGGQEYSSTFAFPTYMTSFFVGITDSEGKTIFKYAEMADEKLTSLDEVSAAARTRSGNTSGDYTPWPYTHGYEDANGNLIASANMNHNQWGSSDLQSMPYGGWIVPDPLTEGQKLRVQKYFQSHPDLDYEDPQYANFFVQQVYTGGTDAPTTGNHESTIGADGQGHKGMTLNQLTVGAAGSHINDFNAGTCTTSQVLNHEGKTQSDQITLMLNVDDTSCFGFHETSGSNVQASTNHNDKMALVSAAVIDEWGDAQGIGEKVDDKWHRSFMGFDYELLPECDIVTDNYALLSKVPNLNNIQYAWDGTKVMTIGPVPEDIPGTPDTKNPDFDLMPYFANHAIGNNNATCTTGNGKISCHFPQYSSITFGQGYQDWSPYSKLVIEFEASPIKGSIMNTSFNVGDTKVEVDLNNEQWYGDNSGPTISTYDGSTGTLNITSVKLIGKTIPGTPGTTYNPSDYYNPTYLLGDADADKIALYSRNTNMYGGVVRTLTENEMKTSEGYLDLTLFQTLKSQGYHPITDDLKTWVKWQAACDGYYSDWIVTLTEAKRQDGGGGGGNNNTEERVIYTYAFEDSHLKSDYDMNDVVVQAQESLDGTSVTFTLVAAGCEYDNIVYINGSAVTWNNGKSEVHEALGAEEGQLVNTHSRTGVDNKTPATYTISKNASDSFNFQTLDIKIKPSGGDVATGKDGGDGYVHLAETGQAPTGIVVPCAWKWPQERYTVSTAYKKFNLWASSTSGDLRTASADWYKTETAEEISTNVDGTINGNVIDYR